MDGIFRTEAGQSSTSAFRFTETTLEGSYVYGRADANGRMVLTSQNETTRVDATGIHSARFTRDFAGKITDQRIDHRLRK